MATVAHVSESTQTVNPDATDRVVLEGISWEHHEILREHEANRHVRMAYDDGSPELLSPSRKHEEIEINLGQMLKTIASVLGLPFKPLAGTTWTSPGEGKAKKDHGCFYVANYSRVRHKKIDLNVDPPPDLAIGVPEVW